MRRIFIFLFLFMSFTYFSLADKQINLKSGTSYNGEIISETDTEIQLKTRDGITITVLKEVIESITEAKIRIVVKSRKVFEGQIIEETDNIIKMTTDEGVTVDIPKQEIMSQSYASEAQNIRETIDYYDYRNHGRNRKLTSPLYEQKDTDLHEDIGLTILFPGGLNFVYSRTTNVLGFRIQGGYLGAMYGYSGNLLINLKKSRNFDINIGFCAGYTAIEEQEKEKFYDTYGSYYNFYTSMGDFKYGGVSLDVHYNGFFAELAIVFGEETFESDIISSPQAILQLGYLIRI